MSLRVVSGILPAVLYAIFCLTDFSSDPTFRPQNRINR